MADRDVEAIASLFSAVEFLVRDAVQRARKEEREARETGYSGFSDHLIELEDVERQLQEAHYSFNSYV